jgi:hypothetical protein
MMTAAVRLLRVPPAGWEPSGPWLSADALWVAAVAATTKAIALLGRQC